MVIALLQAGFALLLKLRIFMNIFHRVQNAWNACKQLMFHVEPNSIIHPVSQNYFA
jgi:hypothetical protein